MKSIRKNGTNKGNGWWYEFADGNRGWVLGMSAAECKMEERKHGKLIYMGERYIW